MNHMVEIAKNSEGQVWTKTTLQTDGKSEITLTQQTTLHTKYKSKQEGLVSLIEEVFQLYAKREEKLELSTSLNYRALLGLAYYSGKIDGLIRGLDGEEEHESYKKRRDELASEKHVIKYLEKHGINIKDYEI